MKILDIRVLGDPVLRKETTPVTEITDELIGLIEDMYATMYAAEGIGLAAPQVGRTERIAVVDVDGAKYTLINPQVIDSSGSSRAEEGCLSIPDVYGEVTRPEHVLVRAKDEFGNEFEVQASELLGRCLQHEIDHLDGKLFIDYLSMFKKRSVASDWEKRKDEYPGFIRKVALEKKGPHHSEGEL